MVFRSGYRHTGRSSCTQFILYTYDRREQWWCAQSRPGSRAAHLHNDFFDTGVARFCRPGTRTRSGGREARRGSKKNLIPPWWNSAEARWLPVVMYPGRHRRIAAVLYGRRGGSQPIRRFSMWEKKSDCKGKNIQGIQIWTSFGLIFDQFVTWTLFIIFVIHQLFYSMITLFMLFARYFAFQLAHVMKQWNDESYNIKFSEIFILSWEMTITFTRSKLGNFLFREKYIFNKSELKRIGLFCKIYYYFIDFSYSVCKLFIFSLHSVIKILIRNDNKEHNFIINLFKYLILSILISDNMNLWNNYIF